MRMELFFNDVLDKKKQLFSSITKNRNFPKGLTQDFCQKLQNFLLLFLRAK